MAPLPQARLLLLPAAAPAASSCPASPPRKRQRLAHLSPEEKALRRKLKNRVAAQSARDRKKARMGELERQALELEAENLRLVAENQALKEQGQQLSLENRELRLRLGLPALPPSEPRGEDFKVEVLGLPQQQQQEEQEEEAGEEEGPPSEGPATGSAESAALRLRVPLQQGQAQQSPPPSFSAAASTWIQTAWTLQTLSLIFSWAFWTAWIQTCSCAAAAPRQPAWRSCSRRCVAEKRIPYQPPRVPLWGPHHPSWRPLMN
ncbi:X-box-binding protein 1 isoform X2 [Hemicordylus capensis]|uniref:X-box-binding protein 1 isoform X2 n=1 Tax=Hemicordylus capensis TaxID=884348 RepID=UPI002302003E|nr:X-box-binding protein 1 isoform X2 [Hemicordylus capensis]